MTTDNPFLLENETAYRAWRTEKLRDYPSRLEQMWVNIADPLQLSAAERQALLARCRKSNMALYRLPAEPPLEKTALRQLGAQIGLVNLDHNLYAEEDGITALQVVENSPAQAYIPYSNRPISWHTDGYYNPPDRQVRGLMLHCARPAVSGGENDYLDHEIAYLWLRDLNPEYIFALMQPDVMTIPANVENGVEIRPAQSGAVFSIDAAGFLEMRYTARARNIIWKKDPLTQAAVKQLTVLLNAPSPYIFYYCLQAGEGVICNNVLHTRRVFTDTPEKGRQRLLYRARYYDRVVNA